MTCRQLGGACDETFRADTFEEIAGLSQAHGRAMYEANDAAHLAAMKAMGELMHDPQAMKAWMDERRSEFDALPED